MREGSRTLALYLLGVALAGCVDADTKGHIEPAPETLGPEFARLHGPWSACLGGLVLYRGDRTLQSQCFAADGGFIGERVGSLTQEANFDLESLLANADPSDTTPTDPAGLCGATDSLGTVTLHVLGETVSFEHECVPAGVAELYPYVEAMWLELESCGQDGFELLDPDVLGCEP